MNTKVSTFSTNNPTDQWVLIVDDYFGYFPTQDEAQKVYDSIGMIDDSNFGSCQLLPPKHTCKYINNYQPEGGVKEITDYHPIDIVGYVNKHGCRPKSCNKAWEPAHIRIQKKRQLESFWNGIF